MGGYDYIYTACVSKENLTPFERYNVIKCLENHEHENHNEAVLNEFDGYTNNDNYYFIENKSQPNFLNDLPQDTHPSMRKINVNTNLLTLSLPFTQSSLFFLHFCQTSFTIFVNIF